MLIRKECFDKVGLFDTMLRMGDDYEFFLRVARSYKMWHVDRPLVMYRQHADRGTRSWGRQLQQGIPWEVMVLQRILERDPTVVEELGKRVVSKRLSKTYFNLAYAKLGDGDHSSARQVVQEALRYWPTNPAYLRHYLMTFLTPRKDQKPVPGAVGTSCLGSASFPELPCSAISTLGFVSTFYCFQPSRT